MSVYLLVLLLLWCFAILEVYTNNKRIYYVACTIVVFFVGLRFDTGYDWPAYKSLFENIEMFGNVTFVDFQMYSHDYNKEIFFIIFLSAFKWIVNDFQVLLFVCTLFFFVSFSAFISLVTQQRALILAVTYSWLSFSLFFSVLRQSIALGFFFLFIYFVIKRKSVILQYACILFSLLFQYSAVIYFFVYYVSKIRLNKNVMYVVLSMLLIMVLIGVGPSDYIMKLMSRIPVDVISSKMEYYIAKFEEREQSLLEFLYVFISSAVFGYLLIWSCGKISSYWMKRLCYIGIYSIFFQLVFITESTIRNRLTYFSLPVIYIILFYVMSFHAKYVREMFLYSVLSVSVLYHSVFLRKDNALPFIPYQNYIIYSLTGDSGDSLERYEQMRQQMR